MAPYVRYDESASQYVLVQPGHAPELLDSSSIAAAIMSEEPAEDDNNHLYDILLLSKETGQEDLEIGTSKEKHALRIIKAADVPDFLLDAYLVPRPQHLFVASTMGHVSNLHLIVSIKSGTGEAQAFCDNVVRPALHWIGLSPDTHITTSENFITELTTSLFIPRANQGIAQTLLLLAGDGAVVDILNAMSSSQLSILFVKPTIGLIPMGTGNALANSTGLNRDMTRGLRTLFHGHPQSLPTLKATFSAGSKLLSDEGRESEEVSLFRGAVVCSWALHASLVADSDTTEYRKHGAQRFAMAAQELLSPSDGSLPHVFQGEITVYTADSEMMLTPRVLPQHDHMYILVTLVSHLQETFSISPESKPLDGRLRLLRFGPMGSNEVLRLMGLAYQGGQHVHEREVEYEDIERLDIKFEEEDSCWRRVCVDGRIVQVDQGGFVEITKGPTTFLDIISDCD